MVKISRSENRTFIVRSTVLATYQTSALTDKNFLRGLTIADLRFSDVNVNFVRTAHLHIACAFPTPIDLDTPFLHMAAFIAGRRA